MQLNPVEMQLVDASDFFYSLAVIVGLTSKDDFFFFFFLINLIKNNLDGEKILHPEEEELKSQLTKNFFCLNNFFSP